MDNTGPKPRSHLFGYLDETGLLHTPATDRFFGIGIVILQSPRHLHREIIKLKARRQLADEFKFNDVNHNNLPVYKELLDIALNERKLRFLAQIIDKKGKQHPHQYKAYNKYAGELIADGIGCSKEKTSEYITILADDVSTNDKDDKFERDVRMHVKKAHRRNALFGIARLESHAVSEIQLVDVLVGTTAYAFKMNEGVVSTRGAKSQLVKYLQLKLDLNQLADNVKAHKKNGIFIKISHK